MIRQIGKTRWKTAWENKVRLHQIIMLPLGSFLVRVLNRFRCPVFPSLPGFGPETTGASCHWHIGPKVEQLAQKNKDLARPTGEICKSCLGKISGESMVFIHANILSGSMRYERIFGTQAALPLMPLVKVPLQQCESSALSERESLAERKECRFEEIRMKSCLLWSFFFSDSHSPRHAVIVVLCLSFCTMVHIQPQPAAGTLKWVPNGAQVCVQCLRACAYSQKACQACGLTTKRWTSKFKFKTGMAYPPTN